MDNKVLRYCSINLALIVLFALNPYPKWLLPNGTVQIFFFFTTTISLLLYKLKLQKGKTPLFIVLLIYLSYFTLPIIHEFKSGYFLFYIIFLEILFYNTDINIRALDILRKIFIFISAWSLIMMVLHALQFNILSYKYIPDFRYNQNNFYRFYLFSVSLYEREGYICGGAIERICGLFAEPGHFGIYLGLLLASLKFKFNNWGNRILLVAGVFTFSTAFYGIVALGMIYRIIESKDEKRDIWKTIAAIIIFAPFLLINQTFFDNAVGRVTNRNSSSISVSSLVEDRVNQRAKKQFDSFSQTSKIIYGIGGDEAAEENLIVTNWRGIIFRYGIVGLVIICLFIFTLTSGSNYLYQILLLAISILILSHRSYIMYNPGVYLFLYLSSMIQQEVKLDKEIEEDEEEELTSQDYI